MTHPPLKGVGFSEWLPSNLRGARTTTWLAARILVRMDKLHDVRHVTARSQRTLDADDADIGTSHDIAGRLIPARAAIGPTLLRPTSADGARLRSVRLVHLNRPGQLVGKQVDQPAVAGRRDGLRLPSSHLLAGTVKRLAHIEALAFGKASATLRVAL